MLDENSIEVIKELEENIIQESEVKVLEEVVIEQSIESNIIKRTTKIVESSDSVLNDKKEKFKADFIDAFKYNVGSMLVSDFHHLTKNHFINVDFKTVFKCYFEITINDYDKFWDNLQELKLKTSS